MGLGSNVFLAQTRISTFAELVVLKCHSRLAICADCWLKFIRGLGCVTLGRRNEESLCDQTITQVCAFFKIILRTYLGERSLFIHIVLIHEGGVHVSYSVLNCGGQRDPTS